jgi:hypothetical protein
MQLFCGVITSHGTEKSFVKESQSIRQTSLLSYFKKLPQPPQTSATPLPDQSAAITIEAGLSISKTITTR